MERSPGAVTAVTLGGFIPAAGSVVDTLRKIPRIADDYNLIRPGPWVVAMNELLLALVLAGLAIGGTIAIRAAVGLFGLLVRGFLLLVILAMVAIPFIM